MGKKRDADDFYLDSIEAEKEGDREDALVAAKKAKQISKEENRVLLHPFDDRHMIAGNSTVAVEIVDDDHRLENSLSRLVDMARLLGA